MNRIIQYIIMVLIGVFASCQRPELIEQLPNVEVDEADQRRVPILFSAVIPGIGPQTKTMDHEPDINSFHLVVFDESGMYVETAQAQLIEGTFEGIHGQNYHMNFSVTLTLSEEPRIIHFIANCPVDQIVYGHETSIIGNLFVEDGNTAYWSRAEVPHIQVRESTDNTTPEATDTPSTFAADDQTSSDGDNLFRPCTHLQEHLEHVHLLRNFAEIVVEDKTDSYAAEHNTADYFKMKGFVVYNTISMGTVAPYNINTQEFQCFVDHDKAHESEEETVEEIYDYEHLVDSLSYEGHALASATLNTSVSYGPDGRWYGHNYFTDPNLTNTANDLHYFMYERKVSVRTDEEEKWRESPPHVIVNADYNGQNCYYKFDMIYPHSIKDANGNVVDSELRYYNILRNFLYRFQITEVDAPGYTTIEEAIAGPPSNNLAGSSTTSKFEEISVGGASLSVSYTDTTLVSGGEDNKIRFKYLYEPSKPVVEGDVARLVYTVYSPDDPNSDPDDVITNVTALGKVASGTWKDYQDFEITVREPQKTTLEQVIEVRTNNHNLVRKIRFILRKKLQMLVSCKPRIFAGMSVPQTVEIKLPPGLTEDMFPLDLAIEVKGLTLSPDAQRNTIPVQPGKSIVPGKEGQNSFYYIYRVEQADYDVNLPKDNNNNRIVTTHWLTNTVNNASRVYVVNKYFETADTAWVNVDYEFSNAKVVTQNISKGLDRDVSISFVMDGDDQSWGSRAIKVSLVGLRNPTVAANDDETVMNITPANNGNVAISVNGNARTVTISGLKTTDPEGKVGFMVDCPQYMLDSAESGDRVVNSFNGKFVDEDGNDDDGKIDAGAGQAVYYQFEIPTYFANGTQGMVVNVTLDGLVPASSEQNRLFLVESSGSIKKYTFTVSEADTYTLALQTVHDVAGICKVSLNTKAEYYYTPVTSTLNQAMREFTRLSISEVKQGEGRPVTITFNMDTNDGTYANKNIRVSLVGMERKSDNAKSFTVNTSNSEEVTLNTNNRKVTLKNIVTSTVADDLRVSISADDYAPMTATRANRQLGQFTNVSVPERVATDADVPVTLTFELSADDYYDGMTVYVHLDGLKPEANSQLASLTRASTYSYQPTQSGRQTIALMTEYEGERTCYVQLKAPGFEDSEVAEVVQIDAINKTLTKIVATFTMTPGWGSSAPNAENVDVTTSITGDGATISVGKIDKRRTQSTSGWTTTYTYTMTLNNVNIKDALTTSKVTISCKAGTSTYSKEIDIASLLEVNDLTITLE